MQNTSSQAQASATSPSSAATANPMWGGHYTQAPADIMQRINASIDVDKHLYQQDIAASRAHARMLARQGILTVEDAAAIDTGLQQILQEITAGTLPFRQELEDIHMHVEARLKELIGDAAGRLHTARSRNDQVATDFKLWVRDATDQLLQQIQRLQAALIQRAEDHADTILPGFTHLQVAQPVTLGHHLLAYVEMLGRDRSRLTDNRRRLNECPLGAAALAGTSFPLNRHMTAEELGFDRPTANSLDSVSDRDFALDYLYAASVLITHLSRLAEEMVLWSSPLFGFISLSEAFTTGSSIMPQKRNPDAAELVRAKAGSIFGSLHGLLTVMRGLPLTYSKDMQEDKAPVLHTHQQLLLCLTAMQGMMQDFTAQTARMLHAANLGFSTATDVADWLVRELNIPFRQAHHITGSAVRLAESRGCSLADLTLQDWQQIHPDMHDGIFSVLTVEQSVASRQSYGGTAPEQVKRQIDAARERFL